MTETPSSRPSGHRARNGLILAAFVAAAIGIAFTAWQTGTASPLEATAFVTGVFCVWLVTQRSILNFPLGLVTVGIYAYVFFQSGLFASAGLQLIFFALNLVGWYLWLYGGAGRTELAITRAPGKTWLLLGIAAGTAILYPILKAAGGSTIFWDALVTSISLAAQWTQARKFLECWWLWIAANVIYIPVCFFNGLHLSALLYSVFLALAIMGLLEWQKAIRHELR